MGLLTGCQLAQHLQLLGVQCNSLHLPMLSFVAQMLHCFVLSLQALQSQVSTDACLIGFDQVKLRSGIRQKSPVPDEEFLLSSAPELSAGNPGCGSFAQLLQATALFAPAAAQPAL